VKNVSISLLVAAALAAGLGPCGGSDEPATSPAAAAEVTQAPRGDALQRNAADANTLAGAGTDDLEARLASLKGHPVVVNQWASWCGPCRFEFPFFAAAVKKHAAKVAFVGLDSSDGRDAAQRFIDEQPPGFASIFDGDGKAARELGGGRVMPTTLFIGRDGRMVHKKLGGYAKAEDLEADIRRYALGAS
jgi:thiol-disulfide isomerase/thioredoxin